MLLVGFIILRSGSRGQIKDFSCFRKVGKENQEIDQFDQLGNSDSASEHTWVLFWNIRPSGDVEIVMAR